MLQYLFTLTYIWLKWQGFHEINQMICCDAPYLFFLPDGRWEMALPAADFDVLLVRPSLRTDEAALAAFFEVTFFGLFVWDKALPAEVFDFAPVDLLLSVEDAFFAALGLVTLDFAIFCAPLLFRETIPIFTWIC